MRLTAFTLLILLSGCAGSPTKIIPPEFQKWGKGSNHPSFRPTIDHYDLPESHPNKGRYF